MNEPLISVIVPIYKVEKYIHHCVDSILNQTYRNLEIVLVDDGSPDTCPLICDAYALQDSRVMVIHKENGGQSSARNRALDIATGDYIAFVDSDDYLAENMLYIMMKKMLLEGCDIVMCARTDVYSSYQKDTYFLPETRAYSRDEAMSLILQDIIGSQPWDKLYKRHTFDGIRFPEGRIYEDIGTAYLNFDKCKKFAYVHIPLYYYRMNEAGTSFSEKPNKIFDTFMSFYERLKYAEKNSSPVLDKCLEFAFGTALGTLNYHIRFGFEQEKKNLPIADKFLREYKKKIMSNPLISRARKCSLQIYLTCKPLYKLIMWFAIKVKYYRK